MRAVPEITMPCMLFGILFVHIRGRVIVAWPDFSIIDIRGFTNSSLRRGRH
jgi:hypothetical protein